MSHKVGLKPQEIAALWDATRTEVTEWTFDFPIAYLCSGYSPKFRMSSGPLRVTGTALSGAPLQPMKAKRPVMIVRWDEGSTATVLHRVPNQPKTRLFPRSSLFPDVWRFVAAEVARGTPANHIEVVTCGAQVSTADLADPGSRNSS